jgi:deoxyribodipyrimidine photolyase-related protein
MILSNLATLVGIDPRALTDWFWVAYIDAYDWVVEPNVLAMGSFAVGELMTTKPYVSGSAYLKKMSDFCPSCAFDPQTNCPFARLYWAFIARHEARLGRNPRFAGPVASARKRAPEERALDARVHEATLGALADRELLTPESLLRRVQRR